MWLCFCLKKIFLGRHPITCAIPALFYGISRTPAKQKTELPVYRVFRQLHFCWRDWPMLWLICSDADTVLEGEDTVLPLLDVVCRHKGWFFPGSSSYHCSQPLVVCTLSSAGLSSHECFHWPAVKEVLMGIIKCEANESPFKAKVIKSLSASEQLHNIWVVKASPLPCCQSQMKLGMKLEDGAKWCRTRKTHCFRPDKARWPAVVFELCSLFPLL